MAGWGGRGPTGSYLVLKRPFGSPLLRLIVKCVCVFTTGADGVQLQSSISQSGKETSFASFIKFPTVNFVFIYSKQTEVSVRLSINPYFHFLD